MQFLFNTIVAAPVMQQLINLHAQSIFVCLPYLTAASSIKRFALSQDFSLSEQKNGALLLIEDVVLLPLCE